MGCSVECGEAEQKALVKRDEVDSELQELNKRLADCEELKKDKVKDNSKTVK